MNSSNTIHNNIINTKINIAIKSAKRLGLGVAGVDMLRSKRGPLVMEVNASPGLEGVEKASGVDVAEKIIEYIERNEFNYAVYLITLYRFTFFS